MERAIVSNIQPYSIHDGPGIRTVVFLKGCPLRCRWCANPENLEPGMTVGFLSRLCQGCMRCVNSCDHGAIIGGDYRIDRSKCVKCTKCVSACWYEALVQYGEEMTSEKVYKKVARDKMFYDESGGGVTFSGGEPLLHTHFIREVFEKCRADGISTCIETCGCVPGENLEEIRELTDHFLYDIKIMDAELHKKYTGASNALILDNARKLADSGADVLFRKPLIPGVNDDDGDIEATADFIRSLGRSIPLQLMPYHRMGVSKYEALQKEYTMAGLEPMKISEAEAVSEKYHALGIECSVSK